ncbi:MAG: prepilin-type N-terminal cleavage/methylation domain [Armatimonadetes bacterium]|jgi:hypothetical protein|nr:prepilin-type N-terminal cleavage/methylation domain [Armatimonadota bacterium]
MMANPVRTTANRKGRWVRRRGVSLVEVLVVLVVLIVGFAAMARLFPEGFASLGFTANATQAVGLMKQTEENLLQHRENVPDAIVGIDPNTGAIRSSITPQDYLTAFRHFNISGTQVEDERFSNINQSRRVIGEHFLVPPPVNAPNGERASMYRPLFGPIYSSTATPPSATVPASLGISAYSGTALRRVVFEDTPTPENWQELFELGDFGYGIDYDHARLYFVSTNSVRLFKIDLRYRGGPSVEREGIQDNCFYLDADGSAPRQITFDLKATLTPNYGCNYTPVPSAAILDQGTEFIYRRFVEIPVAQAFSPTEPYEFKVYDGVFGLLGLNPNAATVPLPKQQGRGLTAQIDYDVDDWHILHEDTNVTTVPVDPDGSLLNGAAGGTFTGDETYVIKLTTNAIKKLGETEATINFVSGQPITNNTYEYQGLQRYYPDTPGRVGTPNIDLVIVDLETGYQLESTTLQKGGNNVNGEIDYDAGIIHLWKFAGRSSGGTPIGWMPPFGLQSGLPQQPIDPAGRRIRVFFRAYNDMGVATVKPYNRYYLQTNLALIQQREYFPYNAGYLLLPPMEGEKTLAVDYRYLWQNPASPSQPELRQVLGEMHQVSMPGTPAAPSGLAAPYNRLWWLRVAHGDVDAAKPGGDAAGDPDVVPGSVMITGVRGASVHTHVVWKDGNRWRHRQRATILTRTESR